MAKFYFLQEVRLLECKVYTAGNTYNCYEIMSTNSTSLTLIYPHWLNMINMVDIQLKYIYLWIVEWPARFVMLLNTKN